MNGLWNNTALINIMSGLVGDVNAALTTKASGGAPNRVLVNPGLEVAWDACECGQLAIVWTRAFRTSNFPNDRAGVRTNCDDYKIVFDMAMSIVRCVTGPGSGVSEIAPKPAKMTADAGVLLDDAFWTWETVDCSLQQLQGVNIISDYIINDQVPLGPLGSCAGSELHFQVGLFAPCPCE